MLDRPVLVEHELGLAPDESPAAAATTGAEGSSVAITAPELSTAPPPPPQAGSTRYSSKVGTCVWWAVPLRSGVVNADGGFMSIAFDIDNWWINFSCIQRGKGRLLPSAMYARVFRL